MGFDFDYLEKRLEQEISNIYLSLIKYEDISSFALYTDAGGMTLCVAANTNEYLEKLQEEPDEVCYYTWVPDEWKHNYIDSKVLDELSNLLSLYVLNNNKNFNLYLKRFIEICIKSLESLKIKHHSNLEKTMLLFTISDYDGSLEKLEWVKRLNNTNIVKEYEKCVYEF